MTQQEQLRKMALRFGPILADNNRREQEALQGYYNLLNEIDMYCRDEGKNNPVLEKFWRKYLEPLRAATEEKISDELNHSESLTQEMIKFGRVQPASD